MKINSYKILGIMSGTSLDGIDLAVINFSKEKDWNFHIETAETVAYENFWKEDLSNAINMGPEELEMLDEKYTTYLADVINTFLQSNDINDLDAICSHGHTIKHEPENGLTLQIG